MTVVLLSLPKELQEDHGGKVIGRIGVFTAYPFYMLAQKLSESLVKVEGNVVVAADGDLLHQGNHNLLELRDIFEDHVFSKPEDALYGLLLQVREDSVSQLND